MALAWEDLGAAALARQFPRPGDGDAGTDVPAAVAAVGPMQTQTARSAFLGLAARFPGVTRDAISAAYEAGDVVRGSTIRGTVHTATPQHFALLGPATRVGQRRRWPQALKMAEENVEALWSATEHFAREWRTPDELQAHLVAWLREHDSAEAAARAEDTAGRYLSFGHGGLVRRPASGSGWEGQGRPVYRTLDPTPGGPTPGGAAGTGATALADVVRLHLTRHGPASRHDLAWWAGLPLAAVDEAVAEVGPTEEAGPDGRTYLDLPGAAPPRDLPGVRLLPEFDALLCAYDPRARERFVSPEHHERLWNAANGLLLPPLLVDGRISGYWRLAGGGRRREVQVTWFARTRRPARSELVEPVAAVEAALAVTVTGVTVTRELV